MNKGTTIAFDNTGKVWKTRYSFVPTRYAYLDKKLLSCSGPRGGGYDNKPLIWRHDEKTEKINNFYGEQFRSSLKTSFNKDLSANKLYKSLSLEGTTNLKGGANRFLANSTSQKSHLRDATVGKLKEKGGILYADLGRGRQNSNSKVEIVGTITGVSRLFSSPEDENIYGYSYDPSLIKLDVSFLSSSFSSSSEFKILIGVDEPGNSTLEGGFTNISGRSYDDLEAKFTSPPSGASRGASYLILRDLTYTEGGEAFGDIDGDGEIGVSDLIELLGQFGDISNTDDLLSGDFNEDGVVNIADILMFLASFGQGDTPPNYGFLLALQTLITVAQAQNQALFAFIATPNEINGRDPKGHYADLFLDLGVQGTEDFELDILNLNYEHTRLDHSS